jgi:hypothetical protein
MFVKKTEEGQNDSLEIVEEGNQKPLLRLRSPMLPELVGGIVQSICDLMGTMGEHKIHKSSMPFVFSCDDVYCPA